jgi:hypothetical protein
MKEPYLEVTFRHGRAIAAYFYLPRRAGDRSYRTSQPARGLVVDITRNGKPIGIEITAPTKVSLTVLNRVLREFGFSPLRRADLAPLRAA